MTLFRILLHLLFHWTLSGVAAVSQEVSWFDVLGQTELTATLTMEFIVHGPQILLSNEGQESKPLTPMQIAPWQFKITPWPSVMNEKVADLQSAHKNCTIPGREYLLARYIGDVHISDYVKLKLGTGRWAVSYHGGAIDDSWKDLPIFAAQTDNWYTSDGGGKHFVMRPSRSGGKGWLRTSQYGGKCAGLSDDGSYLVMWRCNKDGTYPSFFISSGISRTAQNQMFQESYVYIRHPNHPDKIYRPYIHPDNWNGDSQIFLDVCSPEFQMEDGTPFSAGVFGKRTSLEDRALEAKESLPFLIGHRFNAQQSWWLHNCVESSRCQEWNAARDEIVKSS